MMKRVLTVVVLLLSGIVAAHGDYVFWTTVGGRYGTIDERMRTLTGSRATRMSSFDVLLEYYQFYDESNIGFFYHNAFLLPTSGALAIAGMTSSSDLSVYDFRLGAEIAGGPAFRVALGRGANLVTGIGPVAANVTGWAENQQYDRGYALGIMGIVGLKLDLERRFFIKFGLSLGYYFANYSQGSGCAYSYSTLTFSPYIGLGVNNYVKQFKVKHRFSWL